MKFLHAVREQPWAQWVICFDDPDGHMVEIGETMEATVQRLQWEGLKVEAICLRTSMSGSFVKIALGEIG